MEAPYENYFQLVQFLFEINEIWVTADKGQILRNPIQKHKEPNLIFV